MNARKDRFAGLFPALATLVENGVELRINGGGYRLQIAALCDGSEIICQFHCDDMPAAEIFEKLEKLAIHHDEDGIATDEVNGIEYSAW